MQRRVEAVVQAEELIEVPVNALGLQELRIRRAVDLIFGADALGRSFGRIRFEEKPKLRKVHHLPPREIAHKSAALREHPEPTLFFEADQRGPNWRAAQTELPSQACFGELLPRLVAEGENARFNFVICLG